MLPSDVDARVGDVCDSQAVRSAVAGVDVVVHLAALLHQFGDSAGLGPEYERVNVGGTENVVRAATAEGVGRVVFLSTIAVDGPTSGQLIDENTPARPATIYGQTKLAAEQAVLSATSGGKPIGTVLRAAAVYGSRVKGNYRRLALTYRAAPVRSRWVRSNRRTVVHDRDLAIAAVLAASHPGAVGAVFNVSDGRIHTLADIIGAIYRAIGRRPPRFRVPLGMVRAATSVSEKAARLVGLHPPITKSLLEKYTEDVAVEATLIQRTLGFAPSVDLESGWQQTMAALRNARAWQGPR